MAVDRGLIGVNRMELLSADELQGLVLGEPVLAKTKHT